MGRTPQVAGASSSNGMYGSYASHELLEVYEEMRQILATLAAEGVDIGPSQEADSAKAHFGMAFRHFKRVWVLALNSVARWCGLAAKRSQQQRPKLSVSARESAEDLSVLGTASKPAELDAIPSAEDLAQRGLIMPIGTWKEKWDLVVLFLILYSALVVPVRVCFDEDAHGVMWYVEVSMTFAFIVDMYFTFNTVYFDNLSGQWVTSRGAIAGAYLRSWFWIDAPSSLPIELLDLVIDNQALGLLRFLRMFRLLRLLRLLKIEEYVEALENQLDVNLRILRVIFMLIKICFMAHILGCFWYYAAVLSGAEGGPTWANTYDDGKVAQPGVPTSVKYLYSVYWAVTTLTTVGYGDVIPTNDTERGYALAAMLCSALVFGYMISNIGSLVASMDRQARRAAPRPMRRTPLSRRAAATTAMRRHRHHRDASPPPRATAACHRRVPPPRASTACHHRDVPPPPRATAACHCRVPLPRATAARPACGSAPAAWAERASRDTMGDARRRRWWRRRRMP